MVLLQNYYRAGCDKTQVFWFLKPLEYPDLMKSLILTLFLACASPLFAQSEWEPVHLGHYGSISQVIEDQAGNLYARGDNIYRSADGGMSWQLISLDAGSLVAGSLDTMYVHSAEGLRFITSTRSAFDSIGKPTYSTRIVRHPTGLLLNAGGTLSVSRDGGRTWDHLYYGNDEVVWANEVLVDRNGDIVALFYKEVYRSTDAGVSWKVDTVKAIDLQFFRQNFFVTANNHYVIQTGLPILVSTDQGLTWRDVQDSLRINGRLAQSYIADSLGNVLGIFRDSLVAFDKDWKPHYMGRMTHLSGATDQMIWGRRSTIGWAQYPDSTFTVADSGMRTLPIKEIHLRKNLEPRVISTRDFERRNGRWIQLDTIIRPFLESSTKIISWRYNSGTSSIYSSSDEGRSWVTS